ncbi:MAG TPA: DUF1289 domain-containing protein [Steroidobacteraceae bacterium]|nr:DUF1289 domain-containing protein [Steroidobacteraceae bacterium]
MPSPSERSSVSSPVQSPCVNVCRLDAEGATCVGCRRTLGEIAEWSSASEARRREILAAVKLRTLRA